MPDSGTFVNTTYGNANAYTGNMTTTNEMSPGMKTYWNTDGLENTRANLVYEQFAKKYRLPANHGMTMEWRKWKTVPKIDRLYEGVIPQGKPFGQTATTASIAQYGDFVAISEQLDMKHVDPVISGASTELAYGAARTMNELHRDGILAGATNVLYAETIDTTNGNAYVGQPVSVYELSNAPAAMNPLTPEMVAQVKTLMESANVPDINGSYVGVVHPEAVHDLMRNEEWTDVHKYASPEEIYNGELGSLYGVRFVKSTEAPVMAGQPLFSGSQRYLTVSAYSALSAAGTITNGHGVGSIYRITVSETLANATVDLAELIGQYILVEQSTGIEDRLTVCGVDLGSNYIYVEEAPDATIAQGNYLLPGNGGAESQSANSQVAVYASMFFGRDAYGVIDPDGGAIQMIIKDKGTIGGPLEQYSTVGVKFECGSKILYQERCLVLYHTGRFSDRSKPNWRM